MIINPFLFAFFCQIYFLVWLQYSINFYKCNDAGNNEL